MSLSISEAGARARKALNRPAEPPKPPRRGVPVLRNFVRRSSENTAYTLGLRDRRVGEEHRGGELARGYEGFYQGGWVDGRRIPKVAKPNPLPPWLVALIDAEDEAREGRAA